jgi:predicted transglutaminase-like cysteine proteinase
MKFWSLALLSAGAAYGISEGANARSVSLGHDESVPQTQMQVHGLADAPIGHVEFCRTHPSECRASTGGEATVMLTTRRWQQLQSVNQEVNLAVKPVSDQAQYGVIEHWTYPTTGMGDCEDYVLLKKRKLMQLGWPAGALLITVVRDENDEGHAVLSVRTDRGDLILDNKHSRILAWHNTPYIFIKRQSGVRTQAWESLIPLQSEPTVAASGSDAQK